MVGQVTRAQYGSIAFMPYGPRPNGRRWKLKAKSEIAISKC